MSQDRQTAQHASVSSKKPSRHAHDVALVFEGGGMRASYTAGMVVTLLEEGITFDHVCGISAGSSHTVNFLSGDIRRTKESFVDFSQEPEFGGARSFVQGKGMFSAHWIYQEAGLPDGKLPFNFEAFQANPTPCSIQAFDRDTGETVVWTRDDIATLEDLMIRVEASSTLPTVMPAVHLNGHVYYDGGLGVGAGVPLQLGLDSGCSRMVVIRTQPKNYRKPTPDIGKSARAVAQSYWRYPHMREALLTRNQRYNEEADKLEALEREGRAYVFYADKMAVTNSTTDLYQLRASYFDGYNQAQAELPQLLEWLGLS